MFQAGISCNQIAADIVVGVSSAISSQLIRNVIFDAMGLGGGVGGLGGFGGVGGF